MTCQRCGKREATVHLVDLVDGKRKVRWLCPACAGKSPEDGQEDPWFGLGGDSDGSSNDEDSYSLASFLGEMFAPAEGSGPSEPVVCPKCGYTLDDFRGTNQLGCPRCYDAFRSPLLSILSHLHRHVSHLGKIPVSGRGGPSRTAALNRVRIALEKAIASEDFEEAARLRDEIQHLDVEEAPDREPES